MSDTENESDTGGTERYRVEVGITRTGVAIVEAEDEDAARKKAKRDAENGRVRLIAEKSFTNNVRSLDTATD